MALMTVLASTFLGISLILHATYPLSTSVMLPLTVPVTNDISNDPKLVGSWQNFKSASSIYISLAEPNTTDTVYVFYKSSCDSDELLTKDSILPEKYFSPPPENIHAGLNYHGNNVPINLATGSYLMYNINVSYINQGCLHLYLIHTADAYFKFIHSSNENTFNGYIERSDCLETEGMHSIVFSITTLQGEFYVAYEARGINFSAEVSGKVVHYSKSGLHTPCQTLLSIENPTCVIETCASTFLCFNPYPTQCILVSAGENKNFVNTKVLVSAKSPFFYGHAAYLILLSMACVGVILITLVLLLAYRIKYISKLHY